MSTRTVPVQVNNEYIKGAGVPVGAAGSHNDVVLEISFSALWDGLTKKITWLDAKGENPTLTILTTDMLKTGETSVYLVPIPAEPKAYAGDMTMTIKGATVTGDVETRATLSTSCTFRVLPSAYDSSADESGDVTPTQAEQLQAEIDDILETISAAEASATAAAASETAASGSATLAMEAKTAAEAAQTAAEAARTAAETAEGNALTYKGDAETAKTAAEAAQAAAETAQGASASSKTDAETAAGTATTKAGEASASAAAALASQQAAAGSAASALDSAASATGSATDAAESQEAAAASESAAAGSAEDAAEDATLSESWAVGGTGTRTGEDNNNAHYWSIVAQGAASGGVSTFNGRSGAVVPTGGDYTPEQVGLGNVPNVATNDQTPTYSQASTLANLTSGEKLSVSLGKIMKAIADFITHKNSTSNPHGVTAAQAGADPSGTASSAVSTHNSSSEAHSTLFAKKADLYSDSLTMKIGRDANGVFIDY